MSCSRHSSGCPTYRPATSSHFRRGHAGSAPSSAGLRSASRTQPSSWTRTHSPERPITRAGMPGCERRDRARTRVRGEPGLPAHLDAVSRVGGRGAAGTGLLASPAAAGLQSAWLAGCWPCACAAGLALALSDGHRRRGTQPSRRTRVHLPLLSRPARAACPRAARPTTGPFGLLRRFSPSSAVTTRSNPSRLVGAVDGVKIHPSTATSRQSPLAVAGLDRRRRQAGSRAGCRSGSRCRSVESLRVPAGPGRRAVAASSEASQQRRLVAGAGRD